MKYAFNKPDGTLARVAEFFDDEGEHSDALAAGAAAEEGCVSTQLPRYRFYQMANKDRSGAANLLQEAQYLNDAAALEAASGQSVLGGYGCLVEAHEGASWRALNPPEPKTEPVEAPVEMPTLPPVGSG